MDTSLLFEIAPKLHAGWVPAESLNGKPPRYSASTVKQFSECARKHFFEQVVGIDPAPSDALTMGTAVHAAIEKWLKEGVVPGERDRAGRVALPGLKHLPAPHTTGMHVEKPFSLSTWPGGPQFTGTKDLYTEPGEDGIPTLYDHKTTRSYARYAANGWALTEATLPDNFQCIAYSHAILRLFPDAPHVDARWVYYEKDKPGAHVVAIKMMREDTRTKWRDRILPVLDDMQTQHKIRPSLSNVPRTESACDSYGGCPHRSYCVNHDGAFALSIKQKEEIKMGRLSEQILSQHRKGSVGLPTEEAQLGLLAIGINPPIQAPDSAHNPFLVAGQEPEIAPPAEAKRGRGRPPKSDAVAQAAAPVAESIATPPPASVKPIETEVPQIKVPGAGAGFTLLIGCYPIKGAKRPVVHADDLLKPLADEVAKINGVAHYGLIDFAQGTKQLTAALVRYLDGNPDALDGKSVFIGSIGPAADAALSVLVPRASLVMQKVV